MVKVTKKTWISKNVYVAEFDIGGFVIVLVDKDKKPIEYAFFGIPDPETHRNGDDKE